MSIVQSKRFHEFHRHFITPRRNGLSYLRSAVFVSNFFRLLLRRGFVLRYASLDASSRLPAVFPLEILNQVDELDGPRVHLGRLRVEREQERPDGLDGALELRHKLGYGGDQDSEAAARRLLVRLVAVVISRRRRRRLLGQELGVEGGEILFGEIARPEEGAEERQLGTGDAQLLAQRRYQVFL